MRPQNFYFSTIKFRQFLTLYRKTIIHIIPVQFHCIPCATQGLPERVTLQELRCFSMLDLLSYRSVLAFTGADRLSFLQGLITNDVQLLTSDTALWSALLTPQGRWLSEFFLFSMSDSILMDCPSDHADMLVKKLSRFRLRADVEIEATDFKVIVDQDSPAPADAICAANDPRCDGAGWRAVVQQTPTEAGHGDVWLKDDLKKASPKLSTLRAKRRWLLRPIWTFCTVYRGKGLLYGSGTDGQDALSWASTPSPPARSDPGWGFS